MTLTVHRPAERSSASPWTVHPGVSARAKASCAPTGSRGGTARACAVETRIALKATPAPQRSRPARAPVVTTSPSSRIRRCYKGRSNLR
jgi:hypothetical protein